MKPRNLDWPPSLVERAYDIASSGQCGNLVEVVRQLKRDGYRAMEIEGYLAGKALRKNLKIMCEAAKAKQ
jgi:hypothetical protein